MKIKIRYFGVIAEELAMEEQWLEWPHAELDVQQLASQTTPHSATLQNGNYKIALNQQIVETGAISDGDEIAFLPPYSGG